MESTESSANRGVLPVTDHVFVGALAEHWPNVQPCLRSEDLLQFTDHIRKVTVASDDETAARDALHQMRYVLDRSLPSRHPVRNAMSLPRDPSASLADLPSVEHILTGLVLPPGEAAAESEDELDQWLLSAPSLTEQQLASAGGAPTRPDLIKLPLNEHHQLPAFQFDGNAQPHPIVSEVNNLLDAAGDPWGVADWWLGENVWLERAPAALLGQNKDSDLRRAAHAALPPDAIRARNEQSESGDEPGRMPGATAQSQEE